MARVCIVSTAHPSHNPRAVKEADALSAAGHAVRLVTCQYSAAAAAWDAAMLRDRGWLMDAVPLYLSPWLRLRDRFRRRAFKLLAGQAGLGAGLAEGAFSLVPGELMRRLVAEPTDFIIAHNPMALAPAAKAARRLGLPFAFDAEDLHSGQLSEAELGSLAHRLVCYLETKYLPRCAYISAPSQHVAERIAQRYRVPVPVVVYNVFPLADRSSLDGRYLDRTSDSFSIFWFSQVVGLDRGLQDLLRAVSLLRGRVQVHVRGDLSDDVREALGDLTRDWSSAASLHFHPKVPPAELLSRTAEHDVGVALETPDCENHRLTVSNKLFFYALAGLALVATETEGQREVMDSMPGSGFTYPPGDDVTLALRLQTLIDSPERLAACKKASLRYAAERYCWEREQERLVAAVDRALGQLRSRP